MDLFKLLGTIVINNKDANDALRETSGEGQKAESKLGKVFSGIGNGAAVVGKAVGVGMVAAGTAMAGLTVKALNLGGELEQNMGGSEAVFKQYAQKMQDTAKTAFENMGLSTAEFLGTANKMGALFQGAGFSIKESSELSAAAMQRAADVASIMGIDTSAAMEAIAGAAKGNFTMMDNLGVAMNDTTIQAYALSKGIDKSTSEMTNQEKIGLAMEMFMEKTAYATGNYAKENETLAGSLGTAKAALTNFLDGSGSVEQLVSAFNNATEVIIKNVTEIAPRLISGLSEVVSQIIPMVPPLLQQFLPVLIEGATSMLAELARILPELAVVVLEQIPVIFEQIRLALEGLFPQLQEPFAVLEGLFSGIWQALQIAWEGIGKPVFEALSSTLSAAHSAVQPLVDAFAEYVTTGGFAADISAAVQTAVDALSAAYEAATGAVQSIVDGFKDAVKWCKEHETAVAMGAVAMGTLTAAIIAYNAAMAIKKAGGIVELAQLAATAIGVGALTVAETAHTVATTVATAATTAFGAAMAFLTSPITLIIAAIGALIAVIVLCVKHWDEIKAVAIKVWDTITDKVENAVSAVKTTVSNWVTAIKDKFAELKEKVAEIFGSIKEKMTAPVEAAQKAIKTIIEKIKGFFDFEFKLPSIKMPHFSISPSGWKVGDLLDGVIPSIGIDWYAKAMRNPMLMDEPTVFGYNAATGRLQGGGEAGSEVVSGTNTLMNMIGSVVEAKTGGQMERIASILAALLEANVTGNNDLLNAILAGQVIQVDGREFGRTVREYA